MKKTFLAMAAAIALLPVLSWGQGSIEVAKNLNYKQPETPQVLDNYLFSTYFASGKAAYNLKGFEIAKPGNPIVSIKVNPAGASYAVLATNGKKSELKVYSSWTVNKPLHEFDKTLAPTAMAYSADSRALYVACADGMMKKFDSKTFQLLDQWALPANADQMETSGNGYYIAAVAGNRVYIINPESKSVRTVIEASSPVRGIDFSKDASLLAVAAQNGDIDVYATKDFKKACNTINRPGATSVSLHPDNKYIAVAKNGNAVEVINFSNPVDCAVIDEPGGSVSYTRFLQDAKDNTYLTFNGAKSIKYKMIQGLSPNYGKMLRDEVMARMEEWSKMGEDETEEEYLARMTDDSRMQQVRLFEEEIATRMAEDLVMHSDVRLGAYNATNGTLTIEFDNMPPVFLTVGEQEVADFMDPGNLEFRNAIYGLTADDTFELVYADVYNKATGKTYSFNNRDRQSLDFLYASDDFVPIELVQQSSMEEMKLTNLKNSIVENAKQIGSISDHTHIDVNTNVVNDYDADGNKITNYIVNFQYDVDAEYSAKEDFGPGKYNASKSPAASSMLNIIKQAFENDFAQYIKPGKKVIIKVTGSADAAPIASRLAYDGSYGEFEDEPYTLGKDLSTITVTKAGGIKTNEQLAFVRAASVRDFIHTQLPQLDKMNTDYRYFVEVSDKKGGEYRRINVEFTFVDAF